MAGARFRRRGLVQADIDEAITTARTPDIRLIVALAAVHAARPKMIRTMQLDDVDLGNRRITVGGHVRPLDLNLLGRYSFTASTPAAGALRPLRDPDAPELDEGDEGADRTPTSGDAGISGRRVLGNRKRRKGS